MKIRQIITVIDIGSTKVDCCIAGVRNENNFDILGVGYCACVGVKSGIITNMDLVGKSVAIAVENAEKAANLKVKSVFVSISGKYTTSKIVSSTINIGGRIIRRQDIDSIIYQKFNKSPETKIIHSIPIIFGIDSLQSISSPLGMFANTLKASINIVTVPKVQLNNIRVCLAKCHLDVLDVVYSGYASGLYALSNESQEKNYIVIDFGGDITSINFFYNGIFSGLEIVPIGSKSITNDISYGLNVSRAHAERLKTLYGAAFISAEDRKSMILVPILEENDVINLQQITKSELNQIIQPRVEEILKLIKMKIDNSIFGTEFRADIVITGGGSLLTGLREFMSEYFKKPIKMKQPYDFIENSGIQINNDFSTAIGMIKFALSSNRYDANKKDNSNQNQNFFRKTISWFENNL